MANDPFFGRGQDSNWNACIGNQSDEENYVDGYLEAAVELVNAIFEKEMYAKRDTLVFPILFNARHSIELILKHVIGELHRMGMIADTHPKSHDISAHFAFLQEKHIADEAIRLSLFELEPYVISLARIDEDGQELRYFENRMGEQSFSDNNIASLELIRDSLGLLKDIWLRMKLRVYALGRERQGQFFTSECSRADLLQIAELLPNRSEWGNPAFIDARAMIRERYELSSRKFQKAAGIIQENRETNLLLGEETDLLHISDELADFLVGKHIDLNSRNRSGRIVGMKSFREGFLAALQADSPENEIKREVVGRVSKPEISDVYAVYYFARNRELPESYEDEVAKGIGILERNEDLRLDILQVFTKSNFVECFIDGLERLGRPSLGAKIRSKYKI
jgi:hypothetical protein